MDVSTIHILTFTSPSFLNDNVKDLTTVPIQGTLGIWVGECLEDPELTLVVIAGLPDELDFQSFFDFIPKRQQRTEMPISALAKCLKAPVTEVTSAVVKDDSDYSQAISLIDTGMQTVLDADDCISAVWKASGKEVIFFVGWASLGAHEKYHQTILENAPDWIKQLPNIIDTNVALHFVFRSIQNVADETS